MSEKPVKDYDKFVVRLPDGMRDVIAYLAKKEGRSMNSEIIVLLELAIKVCEKFGADDGSVLQQFQEQISEINEKQKEIDAKLLIKSNEIEETLSKITGNILDKMLEQYDLVPKKGKNENGTLLTPNKKPT